MKKDLISIDDLDVAQVNGYLDLAERVAAMPDRGKAALLPGKVLMVMFFEPSTRTRLSFEAAMCRLGGAAIGFTDTQSTSVKKGESFQDTIHTVEQYADVLVIRHPQEGAARLAADISRLPVINAGDGSNQHPTQTLLDLYTIKQFLGRLDGIRIALAGDLKYSRTVHSLFSALRMFPGIEFTLVSPESLRLPAYILNAEAMVSGRSMVSGGTMASGGAKAGGETKESGGRKVTESTDIHEAIRTCDIVYMTRIQKERFPDVVEYEKVKDSYCIRASMLAEAPEHMKILHPLPRVNEIAPDVDGTRFAGYFEQVANGLTVRQAILLDALGVRI